MNEKTATRVAFVTVPAIPVVIGAVSTPVTKFDIVTLIVFAAILYLITATVTAAIGAPIFY